MMVSFTDLYYCNQVFWIPNKCIHNIASISLKILCIPFPEKIILVIPAGGKLRVDPQLIWVCSLDFAFTVWF